MNTKTCPMCGGKEFCYLSTRGVGPAIKLGPGIRLSLLKSIPVHDVVCLGCGFVAPSLDDDGLAVLRQKVRSGESVLVTKR